MKIRSKNWEIFKSNFNEYILISGNEVRKISGESSVDIISRLDFIQSVNNKLDDVSKNLNAIDEWLLENRFIDYINDSKYSIFFHLDKNFKLVDTIKANLTKSLINVQDNYDNVDLEIMIVYDTFNKIQFYKLNEVLFKRKKSNFLFIELNENSITLGPLINIEKGTCCLKCIYKRKLYNRNMPYIMLEKINKLNDIQNNISIDELLTDLRLKMYSAFISNEIESILKYDSSKLFSRAISIDMTTYNSDYSEVMTVPNCECNRISVYNPIC